MGERGKRALRDNFDGELKLEFHGAGISSDAELWVYPELDEVLALTADLPTCGTSMVQANGSWRANSL